MIDFSRVTRPSLLYKLFYAYVSVVLRFIYFRRFRVVGRKNIPSDKKEGFLLICNHQLGLLDALSIIYAISPREPVFLARGDIFEKPFIARMLLALRILPAYRQRDVGVEGLDKNDEVFRQSVKLMGEGVVIALFPEGGHQSHHYLGPFKKGFARIAFGYGQTCNFERDLKILPMGHHYSGYSGMQNDVLFTIGKPFTISELYDTYREHPERARFLLTKTAREKVEELMLNIEEPDNYLAVEQLCQMYVPLYEKRTGARRGKLENNLAASQQLNNVLRSLDYGRPAPAPDADAPASAPEEDPRKRRLAGDLIEKAVLYCENLKKLRLSDYVVERADTLGFIARTLLWVLMLPVFALSAVINFVPHKIAEAISRKIKDKMLVHSLKFGVGLFAFPIWYLLLFAVIWIACGKFWIALLALLVMPCTMLIYHHLRMLSTRLMERLRKYRYKIGHNRLFNETQRLRRGIMSGLAALMK